MIACQAHPTPPGRKRIHFFRRFVYCQSLHLASKVSSLFPSYVLMMDVDEYEMNRG
jgi:hypothetical protein